MIVKSKLRASFAAVNRGDYDSIVRQFVGHGPVEHWFSGQHALGGLRTSHVDIEHWYARLAILFPDLHFDIQNICVQGGPWNTLAVVSWRDHLTDRQGRQYSNQGVHVVRLRWGKIVSLRIYCDTQLVQAICSALARQGVHEAEQPIIGIVA